MAKIGWQHIFPFSQSELNTLPNVTDAILDDIKVTDQIRLEFKSFAQRMRDGITPQEMTFTSILVNMKDTIAVYLATKYDKRTARYFNVGFNLINVLPLLQILPNNLPVYGPAVMTQLIGITEEAESLHLPTKQLVEAKSMVKEVLAHSKTELIASIGDKIKEIGEYYIDYLEKT